MIMIKFCAPTATATATAFWPHTTELKIPTLSAQPRPQRHKIIVQSLAKQQVTKSERR